MKLLQHRVWAFLLLISFSCVLITGEVFSFPYLIVVTTSLDVLALHSVLGCIGIAGMLISMRPTSYFRTSGVGRLLSGLLLPLSLINFFLNDKAHYNWPTFSDTYSLVTIIIFCLVWLLFTIGQLAMLVSTKAQQRVAQVAGVSSDLLPSNHTLARILLLLEAGVISTFGIWLISGKASSGSYLAYFTMGFLPRIGYSITAALGVTCIITVLLQRSRVLNNIYYIIAIAGNILLVISVMDFLTRPYIHKGAPALDQPIPLVLLLLFSICTLSALAACVLLIGKKAPPRRTFAL